MTSAPSDSIKSGPEIVKEFVDSLTEGEGIDSGTINAIKELQNSGKLSKTRLLQGLEESRSAITMGNQQITKKQTNDQAS